VERLHKVTDESGADLEGVSKLLLEEVVMKN
jgi:hypothetical protein